MIDIVYQTGAAMEFVMLLSDQFGGYSPMAFHLTYDLEEIEMIERSMRADMIDMGSYSVMRYYPEAM